MTPHVLAWRAWWTWRARRAFRRHVPHLAAWPRLWRASEAAWTDTESPRTDWSLAAGAVAAGVAALLALLA